MDTLVVRDFDTAIDAYIASWEKDFSWESIEFSEQTIFSIKLVGKQWDGRLDYKVAEFVIRLQKALIAAYGEYSEHKVKYNTSVMDKTGLRVTVSIEPGCSCIKAFFKDMWANMESKDKKWAIISIAAILAVPAGIGFWHYCDTQAQTAKISAEIAFEKFKEEKRAEIELKAQERLQDESIRKDAMHAIDRAFDLAEQTAAPVAYLASKMQKEDKIAIDDIKVSASTAKSLFKNVKPVEEVAEERRYFIDGDYVVSLIDREKDRVTITFADKKRTFSLVWLEEAALEDFYHRCARRKSEEALPPIPLQLTATFQGGVFKEGFVQGIGKPREGSMSFQTATLDSASKQEDENASRERTE